MGAPADQFEFVTCKDGSDVELDSTSGVPLLPTSEWHLALTPGDPSNGRRLWTFTRTYNSQVFRYDDNAAKFSNVVLSIVVARNAGQYLRSSLTIISFIMVATLAVTTVPLFPLGPQSCPAESRNASTLGCPNEVGPNIWYNNLGVRISGHLTAFLTIVAAQLRIAEQVPQSPAFTRLDWFHLFAQFLHIVAIIGAVFGYHIVISYQNWTLATLLDRMMFISIAVLYVASSVWLLLGAHSSKGARITERSDIEGFTATGM